MSFRRYLLPLLLAILSLTVGCETVASLGQPPSPTPLPFNLFTAQQVLDALTAAGLSVQNPTREMFVGRGAPGSFRDRYVFEIDTVAPFGGQVMIFETPEGLAEWERYISQLRANSATARDVSYVYVHHNVMLQVNANLPLAQARAYRDALQGMSP
jgi:hypothetical protein